MTGTFDADSFAELSMANERFRFVRVQEGTLPADSGLLELKKEHYSVYLLTVDYFSHYPDVISNHLPPSQQ